MNKIPKVIGVDIQRSFVMLAMVSMQATGDAEMQI